VGFRILSLSATPVSKIENLQNVITALRCSNLEVRDEEDEEIKKYTFDKDITELVIPKDNQVQQIEITLNKIMDSLLPFLK
jgi:ERCC4-related helicase